MFPLPSSSSLNSLTSIDSTDSNYFLTFLFKNGEPVSFSISLEINGFPLEISSNDPFPQPLEISEYLIGNNLLNIKSIHIQTQMEISICEYSYHGLLGLTSQISSLPINQLNISVVPNFCLIFYLS